MPDNIGDLHEHDKDLLILVGLIGCNEGQFYEFGFGSSL
jgi:hypothetical protein